MKNQLLSLVLALITMSGVFGVQNAHAGDGKTLKKAEAAMAKSDWKTAAHEYEILVKAKDNNPVYRTQLGYCYMNLGERQKAIQEFSTAKKIYSEKKKNNNSSQNNDLMLGRVYRESDSLDKAILTLEPLKNSKNKYIREEAEKEIANCKFAQEQKAHPKDYVILNLGAFVNDSTVDHSPVLSPDCSQLYFTSRRHTDSYGALYSDGLVNENMYVSSIVDSTQTWGTPKILEVVNTEAHDAVVTISPDGKELYFYRDEDNGTLYVTKKEGSSWGKPEKLNGYINTPYIEKGAALSPDGNKLYFISDREGTIGGLDIFVSERQDNGDWGFAYNLGPNVNTSEDEEGPFVSKDNTKLFFSSKGHTGMGGYDFFVSTISGKEYSEPKNLGFPLNTTANELYLFECNGKYYFSSLRAGEGMGGYDIYTAGSSSVMETPITFLKGKLRICQGEWPECSISVRDNSTSKSEDVVAKQDGEFTVIAKRGHNYTVDVSVNSSIIFHHVFDVAINAPEELKYKTIQLDPQNECPEEEDSVVVADGDIDPKRYDEYDNNKLYDTYLEIENILFDLNKANALKRNTQLDRLADYLKKNKNAVVLIKGYTDAAGHADNNYTLASNRAQQGKKYLMARGVLNDQIQIGVFGEENPVALNFNPDGTYNEDAKRFNRRIEFKIVQQGVPTMLIRNISSMPEEYKNPGYVRDYVKASHNIEVKSDAVVANDNDREDKKKKTDTYKEDFPDVVNFAKLSVVPQGTGLNIMLNEIVQRLNSDPELKVRVVGHATYDENGDDAAANSRLANSRAESIKNELVKRGGDASRIFTRKAVDGQRIVNFIFIK